MDNKQYFSPQEIEDIKKAVSRAEQKTSGEIVPYFVEQSDTYESVRLRAAMIMGAFALLTSAVLSLSWNFIWHITGVHIVLFTLSCCLLGYLIAYFSKGLQRYLISPELLSKRVRQRALEAFLSEEVFHTKDRTGILIFISYFEHRVEVLGDTGINSKVDTIAWKGIVGHIVEGIKNDTMALGIIKGIDDCGELLKNARVDKPMGNPNELDDGLRMG